MLSPPIYITKLEHVNDFTSCSLCIYNLRTIPLGSASVFIIKVHVLAFCSARPQPCYNVENSRPALYSH